MSTERQGYEPIDATQPEAAVEDSWRGAKALTEVLRGMTESEYRAITSKLAARILEICKGLTINDLHLRRYKDQIIVGVPEQLQELQSENGDKVYPVGSWAFEVRITQGFGEWHHDSIETAVLWHKYWLEVPIWDAVKEVLHNNDEENSSLDLVEHHSRIVKNLDEYRHSKYILKECNIDPEDQKRTWFQRE